MLSKNKQKSYSGNPKASAVLVVYAVASKVQRDMLGGGASFLNLIF